MYELSYSLYGSEKRALGVYPNYSEAVIQMMDMLKIVRNAQCSEFYIENLTDGNIYVFTHSDTESIAS